MGRKGSQRGWRTWDRNLGLRIWLGRKERKLKTQEVSLKTLHSIILGDWGWPDPPALPEFSARVQTPQPRPELRGPSCLLCGMEAHPLGGVTLTAITICHPGHAQCQWAWVSNRGSLTAKRNPWPCGQVLDSLLHLPQALQRKHSSLLNSLLKNLKFFHENIKRKEWKPQILNLKKYPWNKLYCAP